MADDRRTTREEETTSINYDEENSEKEANTEADKNDAMAENQQEVLKDLSVPEEEPSAAVDTIENTEVGLDADENEENSDEKTDTSDSEANENEENPDEKTDTTDGEADVNEENPDEMTDTSDGDADVNEENPDETTDTTDSEAGENEENPDEKADTTDGKAGENEENPDENTDATDGEAGENEENPDENTDTTDGEANENEENSDEKTDTTDGEAGENEENSDEKTDTTDGEADENEENSDENTDTARDEASEEKEEASNTLDEDGGPRRKSPPAFKVDTLEDEEGYVSLADKMKAEKKPLEGRVRDDDDDDEEIEATEEVASEEETTAAEEDNGVLSPTAALDAIEEEAIEEPAAAPSAVLSPKAAMDAIDEMEDFAEEEPAEEAPPAPSVVMSPKAAMDAMEEPAEEAPPAPSVVMSPKAAMDAMEEPAEEAPPAPSVVMSPKGAMEDMEEMIMEPLPPAPSVVMSPKAAMEEFEEFEDMEEITEEPPKQTVSAVLSPKAAMEGLEDIEEESLVLDTSVENFPQPPTPKEQEPQPPEPPAPKVVFKEDAPSKGKVGKDGKRGKNEDWDDEDDDDDDDEEDGEGRSIPWKPILIGVGVLAVLAGLFFGVRAFKDADFHMPKLKAPSMPGKSVTVPLAYAKDDMLYINDLKRTSYKAAENLSDGGNYSYFYTAWGVLTSEDGSTIFYPTEMKEDSTYKLYKRDVSDTAIEDSILVAENVYAYQISKDGTICAYIRLDHDKASLYAHDGEKEMLLSEDVVLNENSFSISSDGSFVVFEKPGKKKDLMTFCSVPIVTEEKKKKDEEEAPAAPPEVKELNKSVVQFATARATDINYFVEKKKDRYNIYEYTFGSEPVLVAENAVSMEVLGNKKDLLYCTKSGLTEVYSDILEDDIKEEDDKMVIPDFGNLTSINTPEYQELVARYNEKAARDEVRLAADKTTFENPLLDCFLWSNGTEIPIDTEVLDAKAANSPAGHFYYSKMDVSDVPKIKISSVRSLDELKYMYYVNLSAAPKQNYVTAPDEEKTAIDRSNISNNGFMVSKNGKRIAFQEVDPLNQTAKLVTATVKGGETEDILDIGTNTDHVSFSGKGDSLYYLDQVDDTGTGQLMVFTGEEEIPQAIASNVSGMQVADDKDVVYYISDVDEVTGTGSLYMYAKGESTQIDDNVFSMQYKKNGKLVYLRGYDLQEKKGDLCYWNGKEATALDTGVSSIFIY